MTHELNNVPMDPVESSILVIRGQMVILDRHLAKLYNVPIRTLHDAVKWNPERFQPGSAFQLTTDEARVLDLAVGQRPGRKYVKRPYVFTADSILTFSSMFRSERAIQANRQILYALIRQWEMLTSKSPFW
jgi:hypothetical protein